MKSENSCKKLSSAFLVVLICLFLSMILLLSLLVKRKIPESEKETEWIYVYVQNEAESASESDLTSETFGWILRSHGERIGIFDENGILLEVLDVQIKTLPKADQLLLEEGIYANSRELLNSLIEDYSE